VFAGGAQFDFDEKKLKGLESPPALEEPNKGFETPKKQLPFIVFDHQCSTYPMDLLLWENITKYARKVV
jgi:hypothetical protein